MLCCRTLIDLLVAIVCNDEEFVLSLSSIYGVHNHISFSNFSWSGREDFIEYSLIHLLKVVAYGAVVVLLLVC